MAMRCSARLLARRLMPAGGTSGMAGPSRPSRRCVASSTVAAKWGSGAGTGCQFGYATSTNTSSIASSKGKGKQAACSITGLGHYHESRSIRLAQAWSASVAWAHRAERAFHTGWLASNADASTSTRPSTFASSTAKASAPPQSSAASLPPAFAGLGTTQLSPDIMLRCTIFDSRGSATSTSGVFKKSRLCSEHGLEPRDLRKIDSRVPNLVPTILARRGGILVNILHIRAMIKKDKVLLFDSYGSTDSQLHSAFVYNLQHNLRPVGAGGLAYEFRALESILVSVLDALRIELGVVRGWTAGVLDELDDDVDREKLRTLLQVSRKLNAFLSRAKAVKGAVVEVLENEEDMQLMYLSTAPPAPATTSAPAPATTSSTTSATSASETRASDPEPGSGGLDQLELLLESFDKQVEEVVAETTQLSSDISNTQEVVELILDNNRNKLLALDLKTSIVTMGVSVGTLWAGLFGMNLRSHLEEMDGAFSVISGVAFGAVILTAGIGLRRLERLRRVGLGQGQGHRKKVKPAWLDKWKRSKVESAAWQTQLQPYPYAWSAGTAGFPYASVWQPHAVPYTPSVGMHSPPPVATAPVGGATQSFVPPSTSATLGATEPPQHEPNAWPTSHHASSATAPHSAPPYPSSHSVEPKSEPQLPSGTTAGAGQLGMGLGSKWDPSTRKKASSFPKKPSPK